MSLPYVLGDTTILTGQLAPSSLVGYEQDLAAYLRFCGDLQAPLNPTTLARWRTHLAHETRLSPHTINRRLAAIRRVIGEAAAQGYIDSATAEGFRRVPERARQSAQGSSQSHDTTSPDPRADPRAVRSSESRDAERLARSSLAVDAGE